MEHIDCNSIAIKPNQMENQTKPLIVITLPNSLSKQQREVMSISIQKQFFVNIKEYCVLLLTDDIPQIKVEGFNPNQFSGIRGKDITTNQMITKRNV